MENKDRTEALASKLEKAMGSHFDPQQFETHKRAIIDLLVDHLPDHSKNEMERAVEISLNQVQQKISWSDYLQIIGWWLPSRWFKVSNAPGFNASTMLLLTDGSVMCQQTGGVLWKRLVPDAKGSYINGTWLDVAPMNTARLYYASAVLSDGRVFFSGGEYTNEGPVETNATEIYNPVTNTWTVIDAPQGWTRVGNAPCCVLADGRLLIGNIDDNRTAFFNPSSNTFIEGPVKGSPSCEESWTLLPDGCVLTVRCNNSMQAEKFVPATNSWVSAGTTPVNLVETNSLEIGTGITLTDGRAFYCGATGRTALYTPTQNPAGTGMWSTGPDFPLGPQGQTIGCKDSPACLLTNGRVLICAGPVDGTGENYLSPAYFYEFDGSTIYRVADAPTNNFAPYQGRMLPLPNGQVLFNCGTSEVFVYSYYAWIDPVWRPSIVAAPTAVHLFCTYTLQGRQLNGLSQANGCSDDASAATNYPLVRIRNIKTGNVSYCRTFDHSTMAVATGSSIQSTTFTVPGFIDEGESEICIVANGISSIPHLITVLPVVPTFTFNERTVSYLLSNVRDGKLLLLGPNGPLDSEQFGNEKIKLAKTAWEKIFTGIIELQKLGTECNKQLLDKLKSYPVAIDTGAIETGQVIENGEQRKQVAGVKIGKEKEMQKA